MNSLPLINVTYKCGVHASEIKLCMNNFEGTQNPQDKYGILYQTFNFFNQNLILKSSLY